MQEQYGCRGTEGLQPSGGEPSGQLREEDNTGLPSASKNQTLLKTGHVLVVDDDPMVRGMVGKLFTRMGCQVHSACDGPEALVKFEQTPAELVITDFEMPLMNGRMLSLRIKSWVPAAKVVVMTGRSPESLADFADENLIDAWLFKPFKLSEMQAMLTRIGLSHLLE